MKWSISRKDAGCYMFEVGMLVGKAVSALWGGVLN